MKVKSKSKNSKLIKKTKKLIIKLKNKSRTSRYKQFGKGKNGGNDESNGGNRKRQKPNESSMEESDIDPYVKAQKNSIEKENNLALSPWIARSELRKPFQNKNSLRHTEPPLAPIFNSNNEKSKFIGQGSSGCGFYPAIKCKDTPDFTDYSSKISKLMTTKKATDEERKYQLIKLEEIEGWDKYFIGNPHKCKPVDNYNKGECTLTDITPENASLLLYENGGPDLYNLLKSPELSLIDVLIGLQNILEGILLLNSKGIYHLDIKSDNIVTGLTEPHNNFRLIDFGMSYKTNESKFLIGTVKFSDIDADYFNEATQMMNNNGSGNRNNKQSKTVMSIPVIKTPTILRIFPFYQFFLTRFFQEEISDRDDIYNILANKFVETFLTTDDNSVKDVIRFYKESGILYRDSDNTRNSTILKGYLDEFKNDTGLYSKVMATLDIYSFGLLLLRLSYKYDEDVISQNLRQFIFDNKILYPNLHDHIIPIDTIKQNYETFILSLSKR